MCEDIIYTVVIGIMIFIFIKFMIKERDYVFVEDTKLL